MCIDLQCPLHSVQNIGLRENQDLGKHQNENTNETGLEPTAKLKLISSSHDIDIDETSLIYPLTIDTPTT